MYIYFNHSIIMYILIIVLLYVLLYILIPLFHTSLLSALRKCPCICSLSFASSQVRNYIKHVFFVPSFCLFIIFYPPLVPNLVVSPSNTNANYFPLLTSFHTLYFMVHLIRSTLWLMLFISFGPRSTVYGLRSPSAWRRMPYWAIWWGRSPPLCAT
jgi:hypothetical protein